MEKIQFATMYNRRRNPPIKMLRASIAQQHMEGTSNINEIVTRYKSTGAVPQINGQMFYGDFTTVKSLAESIRIVNEANDLFMSLPSSLRERFGHDPEKLVKFCMDRRNNDEARSLGLLKPAKDTNKDEERNGPDKNGNEKTGKGDNEEPKKGRRGTEKVED